MEGRSQSLWPVQDALQSLRVLELLGVFDRIFTALAREGAKTEPIMIDATHLKAHRTAASLAQKGGFPRCLGRTKGGLNSKLHAICDGMAGPCYCTLRRAK